MREHDLKNFLYKSLGWLKILLITLLLTSCSLFSRPPIDVKPPVEQTPVVRAVKPNPVLPIKVEFEVITYDFITALQTDVASNKMQPFVFYGVNEDGYINLSIWIKDIERHIKEQNNVIEYYEKILEERLTK